jgi:inositol polyphosphate 5-phosphatase INPP5B/F
VLRTHPNSEYTCFANSLSLLTRLPGHIRDLENYETLLPERLAINAPREIMRLVHWMMTNHVDVVRVVPMVREPPKKHLVATIREVPLRFLRQLSALLTVATSA